MAGKTKRELTPQQPFSEFIADPTISAALVVFGLITLLLSIIEFGQVLYR